MCTPTALLPTWFSRSPLVMSQMWNAEVAELRCTWRQNSNDGHGGSSSKMAAEPTQVRAVWFQEKVKSNGGGLHQGVRLCISTVFAVVD